MPRTCNVEKKSSASFREKPSSKRDYQSPVIRKEKKLAEVSGIAFKVSAKIT